MQYSPNNQIPYISLVDAGMVELIRKALAKRSSARANLVARISKPLERH